MGGVCSLCAKERSGEDGQPLDPRSTAALQSEMSARQTHRGNDQLAVLRNSQKPLGKEASKARSYQEARERRSARRHGSLSGNANERDASNGSETPRVRTSSSTAREMVRAARASRKSIDTIGSSSAVQSGSESNQDRGAAMAPKASMARRSKDGKDKPPPENEEDFEF
eukprot:TRINITY_DN71604_c0_g1_i1.p2 TRINITY_DN71604_c0_g1~~TRINITY_DN71604_c0_g1_i1.p2  ORF type:complete len:176 (-),score=24.78 TRINITY_DN71604_c0_g1_i1:283-789(-)